MLFLTTHSAELGQLILALLGVFSIVAKLTPTTSDNAILDKLLAVVHTLGLTK